MDRTNRTIAFATLAVAVMGAAIGCDKPQARKAIVLNPTTRQSAPAPTTVAVVTPTATTVPAATQAAKKVSHIQVGRMLFEFPDARLLVRKEGDKLNTVLVSNDPPEMLNPAYQGNRYYFEMVLDTVDDIKNIARADFVYKAASAEPQETSNGIFLNGDRQHLYPYDIRVVFDKEGDHLVAELHGTFIDANGQWVPVQARLAAKPEMK